MVGAKLSRIQAWAVATAWFCSLWATVFVEAAVDALDWPWYIHGVVSLGFGAVVHLCVASHHRQRGIPHDGREVAKRLQHIPKRRTERAEALYWGYRDLPSGSKQFPEKADAEYWQWLNQHWPNRALRFGIHELGLSPYAVAKEQTRHTAIRWIRAKRPWWKKLGWPHGWG